MKRLLLETGCLRASRLAGMMLGSLALAIAARAAPPVFQTPQYLTTSVNPSQVIAADYNGDEAMDFSVIAAGEWSYGNGTLSIYLNNGSGVFTRSADYTTGVISQGMAGGDFNADGWPDVFVVNRAPDTISSLQVFLNAGDGSGAMLPLPAIPSGNQAMNAAVGFFNADSHMDVAVTVHSNNHAQILLGNGDGTFTELLPRIPVGAGPEGITCGDLNNDGIDDLAVSNWWGNSVSVLLGNGNGTFVARPSPAIGPRTWNLNAGDLDGDGIMDLVAPSSLVGAVAVLLGTGGGFYQPQHVFPGPVINNFNLVDIDRDGAMDVVAASGAVVVLRGDGNGNLLAAETTPLANAGNGSATADFNGDRAPDVAALVPATRQVAVLLQIPPNNPPVADGGDDITAECAGALTVVPLDGTRSNDPDGDPLTYLWSVPVGSGASIDDPTSPTPCGWFPLGVTSAVLTVSDGRGGTATDPVAVTITDTTPPVVSCAATPAVLWPPNRRMVPVQITLQASDAGSAQADLTIQCQISSSDPDGFPGTPFTGDVNGYDGYTAAVPVSFVHDATSGAFVQSIDLRAERPGHRTSRSYTIFACVTDPSGNATSVSCSVTVPRDTAAPGR